MRNRMRLAFSLIVVFLVCGTTLAQEKSPQTIGGSIEEEMRRLKNAIENKNWTQGYDAANTILTLIEKRKEPVKNDFLADVRFGRALCLLNLGDTKEAAKDLALTTSLDENYLDAYIGLALVFNREGNHIQAKKELERAVGRGYPVREIQKYPELAAYLLESVSFFIALVEKEKEYEVKAKASNPFVCPLRKIAEKKEGGTLITQQPPLSVPEQIQHLEKMKVYLEELTAALEAKDQQHAAQLYTETKKFYEETIKKMDGERKMQMEKLWTDVMTKFQKEFCRIRIETLKGDGEKLLKEFRAAYLSRKVNEALAIYKKIEELYVQVTPLEDEIKKIKEIDTTEMIQTLRTTKENLRTEADKIYQRVLIVKDFNENIMPHIKFKGVIESKDGPPLILLEVPTPEGPVSDALKEGAKVEAFQELFIGTYDPILLELTLNYKNEPIKIRFKPEGE